MAIADLLMQSLPLGFRFRPSDFELIDHYLKGKITGRLRAEDDVIAVIDVCKCEPWDLPDKSLIKQNDPEWFFFSPKDRKYPTGQRFNRATEAGYWKATGKDRLIKKPGKASVSIGTKRTLVFHLGRAPKGKGTCWIMHEYRTTEPEFESGKAGRFVLYKLFKKPKENTRSVDADDSNEQNVDEMESCGPSGTSVPIARMDVPDVTHNGDEAGVKFVQQLDQTFPKQEASESLPLTVNMQPSQVNSSSEVGIDCVASYPSKLVEGCDTLPSNTGDLGSDVAGIEVDSLLGDVVDYLNQDRDKFSPADFHELHSFDDSLLVYPFDVFDGGVMPNLLHSDTTDPEKCLSGFSGVYLYNGDSFTSHVQDVKDNYSCEPVLSKDSDGSIEATAAQDIDDLGDESIPTLPGNCMQANNYICRTKESCSQFAALPREYLSRRVSFGPIVDSLHEEPDDVSMVGPGETTDRSNNEGTEIMQDNCNFVETQRSCEGLTNMENCVSHQGLAIRRLRLRKAHQYVSDNGKRIETMDRNVHELTVSEAAKHDKDLVEREKPITESFSSNNDAETYKTKTKGLASSAGSNYIVELVGMIFTILFVILVACWNFLL